MHAGILFEFMRSENGAKFSRVWECGGDDKIASVCVYVFFILLRCGSDGMCVECVSQTQSHNEYKRKYHEQFSADTVLHLNKCVSNTVSNDNISFTLYSIIANAHTTHTHSINYYSNSDSTLLLTHYFGIIYEYCLHILISILEWTIHNHQDKSTVCALSTVNNGHKQKYVVYTVH